MRRDLGKALGLCLLATVNEASATEPSQPAVPRGAQTKASAPASSTETRLREMFRKGLGQRGEVVLRPGDLQRGVPPVITPSSQAPSASAAPIANARPPAAAASASAASREATRSADKARSGARETPSAAGLAAPVVPGTAAAAVAARQEPAWGYGPRNGPKQWAQMSPAFALCDRGTQQSPIDIVDPVLVEMEPVQFEYKPVRYRVKPSSHTLELAFEPGSELVFRDRRYALQGLRFHRPGEIRQRGKAAEMALYLIHRDEGGRHLILAVNLVRGAALPSIEQVWGNIPIDTGPAPLSTRALEPLQFLPQHRGYFLFMGSLTTPPCTEDVIWLLMQEPITIAPAQIAVFTQLYPPNARETLPAAGRLVKQSD